MTEHTARVAQLISDAADKELGTRPDGQPRRQDHAAAEAITAEYVLIPKEHSVTIPTRGAAKTLRITVTKTGDISLWPDPDAPQGGNILINRDTLINALKAEGII